MQFFLLGKPIAKARHRSFRTKTGIGSFDPQSDDKNHDKWRIVSQMRENRYKMLSVERLHLHLRFGIPYPKKFNSAKRSVQFCNSKPDLDNYIKYLSDVMNGIVYKDDSLICSINAQKIYADQPFSEIKIIPLDNPMTHIEAFKINGDITPEDIENMIKKANLIGQIGNHITKVNIQKDSINGWHISFMTENVLYQRVDEKKEGN